MPNFHSTKILGDLQVTGQIASSVTTGITPLTIASTTLVSNLNADLLDSVHASSFARLDSASTFTTIPAFNGGTTGSTAPFTVDSTFKVSNLNADLLDDKEGSYYAAASSLSNYLPLSGGNIVATSSNYCPLSVSILALDDENNIQEWFRSGVAAPYVYINNNGQIASNLLTAAPFIVSSTTKVDNLNADYLDGNDASAFYLASNPSGYTTNTGTVTSVSAGNGMNFTNITTTGSVTLGTPGDLSSSSTSAVTTNSHTHAITNYALSGTANQITVTGAGKVLGAATTLSLPQNIHTTATPTFGRLTLTQAMTNGTTAAFTSPHLALNATDAVDSTGFVGMTFATSSSENYGWSYGAQRTTGGDGDLIWRNHNSSAQGYEKMKLSDAGDLTIAGTLTVTGTTITLPTSGALTTSTGTLTISTSAGNGDITIAPNGSGRLIHTKALASKGATYTHTWMQFDEDVNGNALYLGSGALTVLGSGESISQIKGQIGATTEGLVFGADDSTTATAFRFIGSLQGGWAGRTEVLSITGAGNATLLGDLTVNGGDITTSATIFSIGNTATGSQTLNLGTAATAADKVKDIHIGTGGVAGSLTEIIIGSAAGGYVTIDSPDTNITGNLTVSGTLTTKNAEEVNIGDAIILLNAEETSTPSENAGIEIERGTATNSSILWNETNDRWELFNGANSTTVSIPSITGNAVTTGDTGTVTNTMLAGSIANAKLSNSTISGVSLGSNLNNLTIGTGLSGTVSTYNGSAAVTISWTHPTFTFSALTAGTETTLTDITLVDSLTASNGHISGGTYRKLVADSNITITPAADGNIKIAATNTDTTYSQAWVDSGNNAILRLTAGGSGSGNDDLTLVAGSSIALTPSGDNLTIASTDTLDSVTDRGTTTTNGITTSAYNMGTTSATTTLSTMQYNATTKSIEFIFA